MITIRPFKEPGDKESYRKGFTVEGHANYAEHGRDIVCAGVSVLTQTAALGIDYYTFADVKQRDGYLQVHIIEDDHTSDTIVKTMLLGLEQLQLQYPEYINLHKTGETM